MKDGGNGDDDVGSYNQMRKQLYMIGNWFFSLLSGTGEDDRDRALADSLKRWIVYQADKYKGLSIGYVRCIYCSFTWEVLIGKTRMLVLACPKCGRREIEELEMKDTGSIPRGDPDIPFGVG